MQISEYTRTCTFSGRIYTHKIPNNTTISDGMCGSTTFSKNASTYTDNAIYIGTTYGGIVVTPTTTVETTEGMVAAEDITEDTMLKRNHGLTCSPPADIDMSLNSINYIVGEGTLSRIPTTLWGNDTQRTTLLSIVTGIDFSVPIHDSVIVKTPQVYYSDDLAELAKSLGYEAWVSPDGAINKYKVIIKTSTERAVTSARIVKAYLCEVPDVPSMLIGPYIRII